VRLSTWAGAETDLNQGDATLQSSQGGPGRDTIRVDPDFNGLAKYLLRLDRYERRALSRRKAAIREFAAIMKRR
jgi:hypothetical protein